MIDVLRPSHNCNRLVSALVNSKRESADLPTSSLMLTCVSEPAYNPRPTSHRRYLLQPPLFRSSRSVLFVVCLLAGTAGGCAVLSDQATVTDAKTPLKRISPSADAIVLDVMFVERPIGDPVLGSLLWSQLDQVSTLPAATVANMERNGFKFGVAATDPPRALQAALGMTGEMVPRDESQAYGFNGHKYARRSGEEISIDAWSGYARCEIDVNQSGKTQTKTYDNVRCAFRVRVERMQDGWAKLVFTPEVHHGEMQLRRVVDKQSFTTTSSQLVDPQFDQRFEVDLNLGEMVVLGADGDDRRSLGSHFFRGGATDNKLQRLLIVRLADMQRVDGVYE